MARKMTYLWEHPDIILSNQKRLCLYPEALVRIISPLVMESLPSMDLADYVICAARDFSMRCLVLLFGILRFNTGTNSETSRKSSDQMRNDK